MEKANLEGRRTFGNKSIKIKVQVLFFKEDNVHYAFMPSLDLIGYGNNDDEAKKSLQVVLDEFLRYTLNKNTLMLELQRLGWKLKNKNKPITAPAMSDLINVNEQLRDIVNSKHYSASDFHVSVPAFA
jgi:hypothetical protein